MAMQVPQYVSESTVQAPNVPQAQVQPITPAASGANVAEAAAGIGQQAEKVGSELVTAQWRRRYIEAMNRKAVAQDKASPFLGQMQDMATKLQQLRGKAALGSVQSFQDQADKIMQAAGKNSQGLELNEVNRALMSHMETLRSSMMHFEAKETNVWRDDSDNAAHGAEVDAAAMAGNKDDLVKHMDAAREISLRMGLRHGADIKDENQNSEISKKSAFEVAKSYAERHLESDPIGTQKMIDSIGDRLSPVNKAQLDKSIHGKLLEARRDSVWDHVSQFRNTDGTIDLRKAENEAKRLSTNLPPGDQDHIISHVKSEAAIEDAALRDARVQQDRKFHDEAIQLQQQGVPHDQVVNQLLKQKGYGFDAEDIDNKTQWLNKLYTHDPSAYDDTWKSRSKSQQAAWKIVQDIATSKFKKREEVLPGDEETGIKTNLRDAYLFNIQKRFNSTTDPQQMIKTAQEELKDLPVGPGKYWGVKTQPQWKLELQADASKNRAMGSLEQAYGRVNAWNAYTRLTQKGVDHPTPQEVERVLKQGKFSGGQ